MKLVVDGGEAQVDDRHAATPLLWGEVVLGEGGEIVTQNFDRYPAELIPPRSR